MLYEYSCKECGTVFEIRIPLDCIMVSAVTCPNCKSEKVKKSYKGIGVIFKGKGFYQNDNNPGKSID